LKPMPIASDATATTAKAGDRLSHLSV